MVLRVARHAEPQDAAIRGPAGSGLTAGAEQPLKTTRGAAGESAELPVLNASIPAARRLRASLALGASSTLSRYPNPASVTKYRGRRESGSNFCLKFRIVTRKLRVSPSLSGPHTARMSSSCVTINPALRARHSSTSILQRREVHFALRASGLTPTQIKLNVSQRNDRLPFRVAHIASQGGAHSRQQLRSAKGLGNEVIRASIERGHFLLFHRARRQHDDRHRRPLTYATNQRHPIAIRQSKVNQHQIRLVRTEASTSPRVAFSASTTR